MSITKRVAYLKGLAEGLELGQNTKEEKLLAAVIDILEEISEELEEIKEDVSALDDDIDQLCEDMHELEDALLEDADSEEEEPNFFEVKCPRCKNELTIDEDMLELGAINCPACNEALEFDLDDEDECNCG